MIIATIAWNVSRNTKTDFRVDLDHSEIVNSSSTESRTLMLRGHFFVFPTVLRILLNCPFFEKHENRFYPTIDHLLYLLLPPHGTNLLKENFPKNCKKH